MVDPMILDSTSARRSEKVTAAPTPLLPPIDSEPPPVPMNLRLYAVTFRLASLAPSPVTLEFSTRALAKVLVLPSASTGDRVIDTEPATAYDGIGLLSGVRVTAAPIPSESCSPPVSA